MDVTATTLLCVLLFAASAVADDYSVVIVGAGKVSSIIKTHHISSSP